MGRVTPNFTSLKKLVIGYKTPYENLQSTPTPLPTAEPSVGQIVYTVSADDLPTLSVTPESKMIVALMYAGGKNTDTATRYVSWRILKNGVSLAYSYITVGAGNFWNLSAFFHNVAVGDVLEIRLWATSGLVNWDYEARQLQFSRVALLEKCILHCNFVALDAQPVLTLGRPYVGGTRPLRVNHRSNMYFSLSSPMDVSPWMQSTVYKLWQIGYGDEYLPDNGIGIASLSYRPYYYRNYVPTVVQLRGIKSIT